LGRHPVQRGERVAPALGLVDAARADFLGTQLGHTPRVKAVRKHHRVALSHEQIRHGLMPGIELALAVARSGEQATATMQRHHRAPHSLRWLEHQRPDNRAIQTGEAKRLARCPLRPSRRQAHKNCQNKR